MDLVEKYAKGSTIIKEAISGITADQLKAVPEAGGWSIHQIVIHVVDAEIVYTGRIKQAVAEEAPKILPYDQDRWTARLDYHKLDMMLYIQLFNLLRQVNAQFLRNISDTDWQRRGYHAEDGALTVQEMVERLVEHVDVHTAKIKKLHRLILEGQE
ncbi:DinB family protein [Aneurinibacillus sp. REN35]|uniref:DinB family protein n=1 Tax=Aneurinibacillus sp. REN35 TaxID=3237286 RepID=UPI003528EC37